jgi:hypothetical protein
MANVESKLRKASRQEDQRRKRDLKRQRREERQGSKSGGRSRSGWGIKISGDAEIPDRATVPRVRPRNSQKWVNEKKSSICAANP